MAQPMAPEMLAQLTAYFEHLNTNLNGLATGFTEGLRRVSRRIDDTKSDKALHHRFPDVEAFDGTDNRNFRNWVTQMGVFFDTQPQKFGTDQARIFYAGNRLRGDALQWYGRQIKDAAKVGTDEHPVWVTWTAFVESMRDLFGRRDEEIEARRRLDNIKQGNRELVAYINELEQLDSLASLSDELKLYIFKRGLSQGLRDRLALWPHELTNYPEASQAALQLNRQTEEFQQLSQKPYRAQPRQTPTPSASQATTNVQVGVTTPADPDAMDWSVDASSLPRKAITAEEKQRRRTEGLCHYCAGKGHIAANCPVKQQRAPPRNSALPGQDQGN